MSGKNCVSPVNYSFFVYTNYGQSTTSVEIGQFPKPGSCCIVINYLPVLNTSSCISTVFQLPRQAANHQSSEDSVLLGEDRRYFHLSDNSSDLQDMEAAVMETPQDVQLWLKLAANKLHNPTL